MGKIDETNMKPTGWVSFGKNPRSGFLNSSWISTNPVQNMKEMLTYKLFTIVMENQ